MEEKMNKQIIVADRQELSEMITEIIRREIEVNRADKDKLQTTSDEKLITKNEMAKELKCSLQKLSYMMRKKQIPYYRFGRNVYFKLSEILDIARNGQFRNSRKSFNSNQLKGVQ
jgi:excisionase family DNA binding protein